MRGAEAVDEQRAVEVVGFVLDDAGHQSVDFACDFVAVEIVRLNLDRRVARDRCANAGDAEAAFFVLFRPRPPLRTGLMNTPSVSLASAVAFGVGHEQAVRQIDLVGGQADAFVLVHQLEHFGDDLPQLGIDAAERLGAVPQRRMGILDDLEAQRDIRNWWDRRGM